MNLKYIKIYRSVYFHFFHLSIVYCYIHFDEFMQIIQQNLCIYIQK